MKILRNYGDLGKRMVAYLLDSFIVTAVYVLVLLCVVYVFRFGWLSGLISVLISGPIVTWLYFILMEGSSKHATLGKIAMNLYVGYEDGRGITYSTAVLRMIGKVLSGLILGIGYLMGFFNDQKQCLHDMVAKTYVFDGKPRNNMKKYANAGKEGFAPDAGNNYYIDVNDGLPELVGVRGPLAGMIYSVGESGLVIGRDSVSCQVVVPASQGKVSRVHCFVTYNPMSGMFVLHDRNSTHGTFLANGRRVLCSQPAALRSGDRFYLATPENSFEVR